ncbi:MAG: hypothetical protein KKF62_09225 [Bacteroidetes bacterium]|nr:hypothetical protein [Bacteroidota bacterium]MBU1116525.1 hypothetical protein [Bacteroidota bacterium]MBU1798407.1 hypothetical protein [Bacteroidota bacterium]
MIHKKLKNILIPLMILSTSLTAQVISHKPSDFRGEVNLRRNSNVDGNNIRATIFNSGYSGDQSGRPDYIEYEWPKNTNRIYIAVIDILLGGEVKSNAGETIQLVEVPTGRTDPASGNSWNLEPVPGFIDPQQSEIARSDNTSSWPNSAQGGWRDKRTDMLDPGWIGSWNGFFGKNIFNADQEFYYVTSDDLYKRQPYTPDTTDYTRGGLGLVMDVRTLAWSQVLINDVIFFIHDIKNDGTKTIEKTSFNMFVADWVGGDNPDDYPYVDLQTATTFLTDANRIGSEAFGSSPVGVASIKYLETPGNQVNGIDDDGDADENADLLTRIIGDYEIIIPHFTTDDFIQKVILPGDKIVLIEPETYDRKITTYPIGGGIVYSLGKEYVLPPEGINVFEDTLANGFDEDLDGLIDEKESLHLFHINELTQLTNPVRYINYLSFNVGEIVKRGFVVAGLDAEWNYQNVAPMIDESRDDGFDNDNDWDKFLDDNGLDGVRETGDAGESDGLPSSGVGTEFPGEASIDKTDVSETDLIGVTSAFQINDGILNFNTTPDRSLWNLLMIPGKINLVRQIGEFQTYVSSGYFPLLPGQRQRMAVSIAIAGGGISGAADIESAVKKQSEAQKAYNADYQFAQAPLQVSLTAVPGDGKVTLYWDSDAEKSFDRYINKIGGNGEDFEGYRIYRATDAAFLDAKVITDAYGVTTLMRPIASFDLADGVTGLHPIDINGVKFDLGNDTGLQHEFIDTDVINGQRYFYAVTAYDFGYETAIFAPSETPIQVNIATDGTMTYGKNVAVVRPTASAAGYLPPEVISFNHTTGGASGTVGFDIIDPNEIKNGHEYELTFKDTVYTENKKDIFKTISFSLEDLTSGNYVLENDKRVGLNDEVPITDGFRLKLSNVEDISINKSQTLWNNPEVYSFDFTKFLFLSFVGVELPSDYKIIIGEVGMATSVDTTLLISKYPAKDVNFKILNTSLNKEIDFVFSEKDGSDGKLSINSSTGKVDAIYFLEEDQTGKRRFTWQLVLNLIGERNPEPGDTLNITINKPFLSFDKYNFTLNGSAISESKAKIELDNIRVVPNPYIAAETWEPRNTYTSGRGPREIHFINLPNECTIRIFNVSGTLVKTINHKTTFENGTEIWDVLSEEKFEIAYGIYVYHVDAPKVGQKTGTFAIIK